MKRTTLLMALPAAFTLAGALTIATALPTASTAQAITLQDVQAPVTAVKPAAGRIAPRGIIRRDVSPPNYGITREDLGLNQRPPNKGITREDLGLDKKRPATKRVVTKTPVKARPATRAEGENTETAKQTRQERRKAKQAQKRDRKLKRDTRKRMSKEFKRNRKTKGFKVHRNHRKGYKRRNNRKRR